MTRKPYGDPSLLGFVFLGGALGTGARELLNTAFGNCDGIPVTIFAINIVGAFILGVLLAFLGTLGDDTGRRRSLRLFLGTGVLGGFTTYSALAYDTAWLFELGRPVWAFAYGIASVVVGLAVAFAGVALGGWLGRKNIGVEQQ